jgi:Ca2+-binding EF-hand superfamily protein
MANSNSTNNIDFNAFIDLMTAGTGTKITKKNVKKIFNLFDD